MKKIENVKKLKNDLKEENETMEIRNNRLRNQLNKLNKEIENLQGKLTPVVQSMQEKNDENAPK